MSVLISPCSLLTAHKALTALRTASCKDSFLYLAIASNQAMTANSIILGRYVRQKKSIDG